MIERINLVPRKATPDKIWAIIGTISGLFFIIAALYFYSIYSSTAKKFDETALLNNQSAEYDNNLLILMDQVKTINLSINDKKSLIKKLSLNANKTNKVNEHKHYYSRALQSIAKQLPKSVKCNKVSVDGNSGTIEGIATIYDALPDFVDKLNDTNKIFSTASLQKIDQTPQLLNTRSARYNFEIAFTLKQ